MPIMSRFSANAPQELHLASVGLVDLGILDYQRAGVAILLSSRARHVRAIRKGYADSGAASLHRRTASEILRGC